MSAKLIAARYITSLRLTALPVRLSGCSGCLLSGLLRGLLPRRRRRTLRRVRPQVRNRRVAHRGVDTA